MPPSTNPAVADSESSALLALALRLVETERLDELGTALVRFALTEVAATRGVFLWARGSRWRVCVVADADGEVQSLDDGFEGDVAPRSLLEQVAASGSPRSVRAPADDVEHGHDAYFRRARPAWALGIPLRDRAGQTGVLYLEACGSRGSFSVDGVERVRLLGALIAGSLRAREPVAADSGFHSSHQDLETERRCLAEAQALARIGSWEWDAEQDVISGSDEFYRLFDVEPEQMAAYPAFAAHVHPEDRARVSAAVQAVMSGRQARYDSEYRVVLSDGAIRYLHAHGLVRVDAAGRRTGLFGTCQDISDRRRAEEAVQAADARLELRVRERTAELRRSMAYTRSLIEAMGDPLLIIDRDGRITDLNHATEQVAGQGRASLIGQDFCRLFTHPDRARGAQRRLLRSGKVHGCELEFHTVNGGSVPVLVDAAAYRNEAGQPAGACVVARDITELRAAQAELLKSKQLLDEACRLSGLCGWDFDPVSGELVWTQNVHQILELEYGCGPSLEQTLGFVAPEAVPTLCAALEAALNQGQAFDLELPMHTARNRPIWVDWVGQVHWQDGRVVRIGGKLRDITQEKRAEAALEDHRHRLEELVAERTATLEAVVADLERSNRDLEQFAYVASHDLQEPLRMVASYTQLLAERYQGRLDERADKYISYAVDGATRMQGLINGLLAFSRVGTHGQGFVPTDAGAVVAEVLKDLERAIENSGAQVVVSTLPVVLADRTQLRQVFQNLIENAIKFRGDAPPHIVISAARERRAWVFTVKDNGIGIDPRFGERIFLIFQRLHERGRYPGSGIGLAIVKKIVERHGGRIHIASKPGHGCSFIFSLPCTPKDQQGER